MKTEENFYSLNKSSKPDQVIEDIKKVPGVLKIRKVTLSQEQIEDWDNPVNSVGLVVTTNETKVQGLDNWFYIAKKIKGVNGCSSQIPQ